MALRLTCYTLPRLELWLIDTPRPRCPQCGGDGWWTDGWDDETGEHPDAEYVNCGCWNPDRRSCLLVVPSWAARFWPGWTPPDTETY
ncbi:hypothetical protein ACFY2K_00670 [Kitasatospora sp. NPDC001309]|uniref:hypothetical protein n=1 Tax=Kitasatospora sp. NPDC001309 TaxID=3364013 RepID=UPI0036A9E7DC